MRSRILLALALLGLMAAAPSTPHWPAPKSPVVADADGYVAIPNAAVVPDKARIYRAIFDATRAADKPTQLLPALNMAGSELNAFEVCELPAKNVRFAVVFHGAAVDGILDDAHYRAKFGVPNPNLKAIGELKRSAVALFVCGQYLAAAGIDPKTLTPDVMVATDALIVLMRYQNDGYALMSF